MKKLRSIDGVPNGRDVSRIIGLKALKSQLIPLLEEKRRLESQLNWVDLRIGSVRSQMSDRRKLIRRKLNDT